MKQFLSVAFLLLALTGCAEFSIPPDFPPYAATNFRGEPRLAADLQRVALLPVHAGTVTTNEAAAAMDPVLLAALQKQARFEVIVVSRDDCRRMFGAESFGSTEALPHGMLEKIAEKYAVDAVVFADLTVYQPYRPISLGLRSKLATVRDVRLVWSFDEIFSAGDEHMLTSVKEYYRRGDRAGPVDAVTSALQSPARFGAVAGDLMFKTLPPR
jgi:hypothetical protein